MAIFVCGDIHGCYSRGCEKLNVKQWPDQKALSEDDTLIILGDAGLVFSLQESKDEYYWIKWLLSKRCTVAFIDGNHENFNRLNQYPISEKWGGNVQIIKTINNKSLYHLMRGEVYIIDNQSIFVMGGAVSIDKGSRREGITWWPQEVPNNKEWYNADRNLKINNNQVDYILAHTGPKKILENLGFGGHLMQKFNDPTTDALQQVIETVKFKQFHFGHFHVDINFMNKFFCHYNNKPYRII